MQWPWQPQPPGRVVLLVRHGRTAWNAQHRFLGRTDIGLDEVGRGEAARLAPLGQRIDRVWSSPLARAYQTAESFGQSIERIEDLMELDQGELEGLEGPEAFAAFPLFFQAFSQDPSTAVVPGGESLGAAQRRGLGVLGRVEGGVTALVSHQMVIASIRCAVAGVSLRDWRQFRVPNASVTVLEEVVDAPTDVVRWRESAARWRPPGSSPSAV